MSLKSEGEAAGRRVDSYLDTISRMEPDIAMVDQGTGVTLHQHETDCRRL